MFLLYYLTGMIAAFFAIVFINRRIKPSYERASVNYVVLVTVFWPLGLPIFSLAALLVNLTNRENKREYRLSKYWASFKRFCEGD